MSMDKFERLKSELFRRGSSAIEDFLGYDIDGIDDKDELDKRMDEIYEQMPEEDLEEYFDRYGIEDICRE